jgi:hypothetical protein
MGESTSLTPDHELLHEALEDLDGDVLLDICHALVRRLTQQQFDAAVDAGDLDVVLDWINEHSSKDDPCSENL